MRIELKREGGLAFIPGLNRPHVFKLGDLPPAQADAIARSVQAASFFERPARVGTASKGAADQTRYVLTIEDEGRRNTVQLLEPVEDPSLRALLDLLKQVERTAVRAAPQSR
ncbi:hypothetical protein D7Y13_00675 [Corallococcus praedator]|uniref:Uncharacterized protein n=1 Tax=Corallococcus praedator TaxID=2316724 RepID=A0ABX9QRE9_9BACT|nr:MULTISPECIES: protealysin inhibitor emfourin [Corallococcus]RKH21158.1 hypothetical protein D7X74_01860 [Corallococcus sp. CA047B]RKH35896.1 hypothetical protein D7X75_02485 [Corallococcus sp. CA031C]RKI17640.1 hypothetical protein D7Y13_00675 [Corallococcus praedator]